MEFVKRHPIVALLALGLIAVQVFPLSFGGRLGDGQVARSILTLSYFPQKLVFGINGSLARGWGNYINLAGIKSENERLREEIKELREEKFRLWEAELQNQRLKKLLDYKNASPIYSVITANVIGASPSALRSEVVIIDRGTRDGISEGMPVVTREGIVGRVYLAGGRSSEVVLITDPVSGVDAYIHRTRARGVIKGTGRGRVIMDYVENKSEVDVGDKVLSSGKDGFFPKGVVIGTVMGVEANGSVVKARVSPDLDLESLEEVIVVLKSPEDAVISE
ncbi:MAG: rod shape-determining protein MreC [Deltaproteobacteria bacterium]